jgi:hypothetical protein
VGTAAPAAPDPKSRTWRWHKATYEERDGKKIVTSLQIT